MITASNSGIRSLERRPAAGAAPPRQLARVAALGLLADDAEVEEASRRATRPARARRAARRSPRRPRRAAARSRSPGARRRRRRARAPSPAATVPAAVISIGKKLRQPVGGDQRRLVAGDGRLRRERVHRLRARDPRDRLHRERRRRRARRAARCPPRSVSGWRNAISTWPRRSSRDLVGRRLPHLDDASASARSSSSPSSRRPRAYSSSGNAAATPAPARRRPSKPSARAARRVGDERHPALAGAGLLRDADPHARRNLSHPRRGRERGTALEAGHSWGPLLADLLGRARGPRPVAARPRAPGHRARDRGSRAALGWASEARSTRSGSAASLHDVGKLVGPTRACSRKPGAADRRTSSARCGRTRSRAHAWSRAASTLRWRGTRRVLHHHERWDGAGYPHRLERRRRSRSRRACSGVADAFDAMTSRPPYRAGARASPAALDELRALRGLAVRPGCLRRSSTLGARRDRAADRARRHRVCAARASTRPRASLACGGSPRR